MKETIKTFVILVLVLLVVLLSVKSMKYYQKSQEKPETKTITVTETLAQVIYDTLFIDHFETVKLPVVDSTVYYITDTVTRVDSVFVEVPISVYKLDTIFTTDTTSLNIRIQNSGYNVKLDSLYYSFTYKPTKINKTKKTHWFIGPSLGIGYDFTSGKLIPTIGIGLIIKRF